MMKTRLILLCVLLLAPYVDAKKTLSEQVKEVEEILSTNESYPIIVTYRDISGTNVLTLDKAQRKIELSRQYGLFKNFQENKLSKLNSSEGIIRSQFVGVNAFSLNLTLSGFKKLIQDPDVLSIRPVRRVYPQLNESRYVVNAYGLANLSISGEGQTICVIDTGVNYTHPDLGACSYTNFIDHKCSKVIGGWNVYDDNADPMDLNGHGTHIAGILSANGSITGLASKAKLVALRVCDSSGTICWEDKVVDAVKWCHNHSEQYNISVISISIGDQGAYSPENCSNDNAGNYSIFEISIKDDIFISAASGNNGYTYGINWPACIENVTSVGATYDTDLGWQPEGSSYSLANCHDPEAMKDNVTCFTNRAENLDLLAPGSYINSTWNVGYKSEFGTSMACPHVSASAALIKQVNSSLSPIEITNILKQTGISIYDSGRSRSDLDGSGLTFKRIDVFGAVASLVFSKVLTVSNTGAGILNVTNVTGGASWIYKIEPKNFTLAANQSINVVVTVDPRGKNNGIYTGNVIFASNDPDQGNYTVPVTMRILSEGCTGDCPPTSGDWVINQDTFLYKAPANIDGKLAVQGGVTLYIGETHVNATNTVELNGSVNLDNGVLRFN